MLICAVFQVEQIQDGKTYLKNKQNNTITKPLNQNKMFEQLILHAIGDYLIQNDWMAQNKKVLTWKGELACQVHCITYSLPFFLIGSWQAVLVIYLTHYAIDRSKFVMWYMRVTGKSDFAKPPLSPWSIFAVDNTFHLVCNYLALYFFTNL